MRSPWQSQVSARLSTLDGGRGSVGGFVVRTVRAAFSLLCMAMGSCARPSDWPPCPAVCTTLASCTAVLNATPQSMAEVVCQNRAAERVGTFGEDGRRVVRDLLGSPVEWQRTLGSHAAATMSPAGASDIAAALVDAYRAHRDRTVLRALEGVNDPLSASLFVELLGSSDGFEAFNAVSYVSKMGARAAPALPALQHLAASHWSGVVRESAARAYATLTGTPLEPARAHCPVSVTRDPPGDLGAATWTVTLRDSSLVLRSVTTSVPATRDPACPADDSKYGEFSVGVGDECVVARRGFECQGSLSVWDGKRMKSLGWAAAGPLVRRRNDVLALNVCRHMVGSWDLDSLSRAQDGAWSRRSITSSPDWGSDVVAFAAGESTVDLLVNDGGPRCERAVDLHGMPAKLPYERATFVMLRIEADGAVTVFE
jgi:hypothetical protein